MVVLSASVLTKTGKAVVSRQFVEMSRMRLEGLIAAFPKLLAEESRQHTFFDTDSVRYVYQPIEAYFLLLITNKTSNIVEDLQILQLLSKIVADVCGNLTEETLSNNVFDLIFAFDEAISVGGHMEHINIQQIQKNLEMDSHEETVHNMILQSKKEAAKGEMKKQQQRIREEQRERARAERAAAGTGGGGLPGMRTGGGSGGASGFRSGSESSGTGTESSGGGFGGSYSGYSRESRAPPPTKKTSGMKLGESKKNSSFMDAMAAEDDLQDIPPMSSTAPEAVSVPPVVVSTKPIVASLEEKVSVQLNREGAMESMEVKGNFFLAANDPDSACSRIKVSMGDNTGITFQTHPKVDKQLWENQRVLGLKNASKPLPSSRVGVLRWVLKTTDESMLPLNLTCWPEEDGEKVTVNMEYTLERDMELNGVDILIPLGTTDLPHIVNIDGDYRHNPRDGTLIWHHDSINRSNQTGSLEFNIRRGDPDSFFPIVVSFYSEETYVELGVDGANLAEGSTPVEYGFSKLLTTDSYVIQ